MGFVNNTVLVKRPDRLYLKNTFNVEQKAGNRWSAETVCGWENHTVIEMWERQGWKLYMTEISVREHLRESFPDMFPLRQNVKFDTKLTGALFGYVECNNKIPEPLPEKNLTISRNFPEAQTCVDEILDRQGRITLREKGYCPNCDEW